MCVCVCVCVRVCVCPQIRQGVRPPIPRHLPDQMQFIISQCWDHNPDLRCDFVTIVDLLELACEALAT